MKGNFESNLAVPASAQDQLALENCRLRGDLLTFATRVSHDLRTPLGGIVNTTELLKEILVQNDPDAAALVEPIFASIDEVTKLIGQLRFVALASAAPRPRETFGMGTVVFRVLQRLESRTLNQQASIREPESWPEVNGVMDWMEFIWWNLIANALQHGGQSPRIELSWQKAYNEHRFQVCDNGPGVPAECVATLFQPFDSLHQSGSSRGIGLSVVQRLMDLQGGSCGYSPNPNGGACFHFTLPFVVSQQLYRTTT